MLSFATDFPIADEQTSDSFLKAVKKWILGSPHTGIKEENFVETAQLPQWSTQQGSESLLLLRAKNDKKEMASVRYKRVDEGLEWTTNVIFSKTSLDAWVAIRVFCESQHPAAQLPPARKPVLIRTLLQELGGGKDGELQIGEAPHLLGNSDIEFASQIIAGNANFRLPVIFASATFHGKHVLDVHRLAKEMAGIAHVVVEPNRAFSLRLKIEANSENVYGGAIGIYWPDGGGRRSYFIGKGYETAGELARSIFEEVRIALTNRRPLERCTWATIQEMVSQQTFEKLKSSGSNEVNKYIEAFDKDLSSKEEKIADAEREIGRLKAELRIYESRSPLSLGTSIQTGAEQDLYPNEILNIILDAIRDHQSRVPIDSRRSHVIESILSKNNITNESELLHARIKETLRGYSKLDAKVRSELEGIGFDITEDGKHYKIIFQGDDRYTYSLSKSGSDHRAGLNAANDIGRLIF